MEAETGVPGGQPEAEPVGTTEAGTEGQTQGQSATPDQTTARGTDAGSTEESFFDPESIKGKPELEAAYKEMQRSYSKKTADLAKGRDKIRQYDEFMNNPLENMRALAQQMGWQLVQGPQDGDGQKPKEFQSWDDVMEEAERRVMDKMKPMFGELQSLKKQNIETYLDNNFSDWRTYEDQMMENLQAHPTLVQNPDLLYRMSVPAEVIEQRAFKRAQQKLQGETQSNSVRGQSSTTKQTSSTPKGPLTFEQSVEVARQQLAQQGLSAPRE